MQRYGNEPQRDASKHGYPGRQQVQDLLAGMIWDKVVDVRHHDGLGQPTNSRGKLKSLDQDGFVYLEDDDGNAILIPKDKVIDLKQPKE